MNNTLLHIITSDLTYCGLSTKIIRCRRRYGYCNLQEGHWPKQPHDAYAIMPNDMITLADDEDSDSDICETCLKLHNI